MPDSICCRLCVTAHRATPYPAGGHCAVDRSLVRRAAPAEAGWIALRPANSTLQSSRSTVMPTFDSAFERFIDAMRNQSEVIA